MKKLVIFDGNSIMNRAFYGVRPLTTKDGLMTNAIYGYVNIIKKHIDKINPDYAFVAFDLKAPTFRHKFYTGYKATRKGMPDELAVQLPYIKEVSSALGLVKLETEGFEADDILGTVSKKASENGMFTYIVTGDKDSLQLVDDTTSVIIASTGTDTEFTPSEILEKYTLPANNLIDVKALAGDTSDNIPGVKGIGEKGAISLIKKASSLERLYEDLDNLDISASLKSKLEADKDNAFLSQFLARICREVPGITIEESMIFKGYNKQKLKELFLKLEFIKLFKSFGLEEEHLQAHNELQDQISFDTAENIPEEEDDFEFETITVKELKEKKDDIFIFIFNEKLYSLIGENEYKVISDISNELKEISPILYSYKDFCHFYHDKTNEDIKGIKCKFDLSIAAYLVNPADNVTTLERLIFIYLQKHITLYDNNSIVKALSSMKLLYETLNKRLNEYDLTKLFYDIELPLAYVLAKTEICGFKLDTKSLKVYGNVLKEKIKELEEEIYSEAGCVFNINSPKQLSHILFEKMELPAKKKTRLGYSTDAETLEKMRFYSPIINLILEFRTLSKLCSTYVEGLLKQKDSEDRVHTSFNQVQTLTGRLSSVEPNLQNIPVRTPLGRELRKYFIAKDDCVLIDADYSQIELRILAHVSGDENLITAFKDNVDIHTKTASEIFKKPIDEVDGEMRTAAKAVNFGIVYGVGEFSLASDLGIKRATAGEYIKNYFLTYPKVKTYLDKAIQNAIKDGFVTTLFNRRRYIPELTSTKKQLRSFGERVAMNTPVQGSAADIIKLSMVNVDKRLEKENLKSKLILQVHDELIIEAPQSEAEYIKTLLKEEMENAVSLSVQLIADVGMGKNWYDAK